MTRVVRGVLQSGHVPAGEQWGFWCEVLRQGRYGATADDWSGFVSFFESVIALEENDVDMNSIGVETKKRWKSAMDKEQVGNPYNKDTIGHFNEENKYSHSNT